MVEVTDPPPVPAIETVSLTKFYDGTTVRALDGVELSVARGEYVAITGPSGCGKSTLLHLIAALDNPTSGTVRVNGRDLRTIASGTRFRREEIGLVFQLHNLLPRLSAQANVEIAMIGAHTSRRQRVTRARELLAAVELQGMESRRPPQLSGGERQRVAIARALANEPQILLADEPTGNLDSASVTTVIALFERLRAEAGMTILLVTHDPVVARAAHRIVHMRDGKVTDPDAGTVVFDTRGAAPGP